MNIFKRVKNIWRLGEIVEVSDNLKNIDLFPQKEQETPHPAVIIKRTSPTEDFLNNAKQNE